MVCATPDCALLQLVESHLSMSNKVAVFFIRTSIKHHVMRFYARVFTLLMREPLIYIIFFKFSGNFDFWVNFKNT